jgi:hypothetical protein
MNNDRKDARQRSRKSAEKENSSLERVEKGQPKDANPLAPPIDNQAGS